MRKVTNNVFGVLLWLMVGGASQAKAAEPEMMVRLYPEPGRMVVQVDREAWKKGSEPAFLVVELQKPTARWYAIKGWRWFPRWVKR